MNEQEIQHLVEETQSPSFTPNSDAQNARGFAFDFDIDASISFIKVRLQFYLNNDLSIHRNYLRNDEKRRGYLTTNRIYSLNRGIEFSSDLNKGFDFFVKLNRTSNKQSFTSGISRIGSLNEFTPYTDIRIDDSFNTLRFGARINIQNIYKNTNKFKRR